MTHAAGTVGAPRPSEAVMSPLCEAGAPARARLAAAGHGREA